MAIDTKSLTQIISDFRKLQSKDSITPESPSAFVKTFTRKDGAWGRSVVSLRDANSKKPNQLRMIRLRFLIGFAKKINPGRTLITTANLVTSLAEFSLIFNPKTQKIHGCGEAEVKFNNGGQWGGTGWGVTL